MFSKLTTVALFLSTATATWTPNEMCDPGVQGGTDEDTKDMPKEAMKNLNVKDEATGKLKATKPDTCLSECQAYSQTNTPKSATAAAVDLTTTLICCQYVRATPASKTGDDVDGTCNAYDMSGDVVKTDGQPDVNKLYSYKNLHQHSDNQSNVAFVTNGVVESGTTEVRGAPAPDNTSKCSDRDVTNCKKPLEVCKSTAAPADNMACIPGTRCAIPGTDERTGSAETDFKVDKGVEICIPFTSCSQSLVLPGQLVGAACTAEIKKTNPTCEGPFKINDKDVTWTCGSTKLIASLAAVLAISSAM